MNSLNMFLGERFVSGLCVIIKTYNEIILWIFLKVLNFKFLRKDVDTVMTMQYVFILKQASRQELWFCLFSVQQIIYVN